ncbi:hypothetical protein KR018_011552 [Drosophila ironensis]|nr:hypothetical protein KR018_011552 [Drosophila ironensis]
MSTRLNFWILFQASLGLSLSYAYRIVESPNNLKTCPAVNYRAPFVELHPEDQHKNFYEVHDPQKNDNIIVKQTKSENWLMRIINIRTVTKKPKPEPAQEVQEKPGDGFLHHLLNILKRNARSKDALQGNNNETKIVFIVKNKPHQRDPHHTQKRDPLPYIM